MNVKKVTIDGVQYELNIDEALKEGVMRKKRNIVSISFGDFFIHPGGRLSPVVVVRVDYDKDLYILMAASVDYSFATYTNQYLSSPKSKEEIINILNKDDMKFVTNLKSKFEEMTNNIAQEYVKQL